VFEYPAGVGTGSAEHTDWGVVTVIAMGETAEPALEFWGGDAVGWVGVPHREDALVVNVGDWMAVMSKGRAVSPRHRVVLGWERRWSMVLFWYPEWGFRVGEVEEEVRKGLEGKISLVEDQRDGGRGKLWDKLEGMEFGAFVEEKWSQVRRLAG